MGKSNVCISSSRSKGPKKACVWCVQETARVLVGLEWNESREIAGEEVLEVSGGHIMQDLLGLFAFAE